MPCRNLHQLPWAGLAVLYLVGYLLLEWATFRSDVSPLGITPWNPSAGLSLALLIARGLHWMPALGLALLLGDIIVRHVHFPWWVELAEIAVTIGGYAPVVAFLRSPAISFDRGLATMRDLLLLATAALAGTMVVALSYSGVLFLAGLLPAMDIPSAVLRHWGGDVIGILAVTPFLLIWTTQAQRLPLRTENFLQGLGILVAVTIVVGSGGGLNEQLFYLLFLPVVWIAVRSGIAGVCLGLFVMQIGLMAALHSRATAVTDVVALQAVLLILLFAGLAIGVLTSEGKRAALRLRQQQAVLVRVGRSIGMGSLSSSLAHEISQPLTAVSNYARAAQRALDAPEPLLAPARDALAKAAAQTARAADIVRKLRSLFEQGQVELSRQRPAALIEECNQLLKEEAAEAVVEIRQVVSGDGPQVLAERTQIVLVLVNLVRNSIEAMAGEPTRPRRIQLSAGPAGPRHWAFEVADTGPGFPDDFDLASHGPGQTSKLHGLGVGLTLCRTIIEAHGGTLSVSGSAAGAVVRFTLRRAEGDEDAEGPRGGVGRR